MDKRITIFDMEDYLCAWLEAELVEERKRLKSQVIKMLDSRKTYGFWKKKYTLIQYADVRAKLDKIFNSDFEKKEVSNSSQQ
jgi:hypothetical protein